MTSQTFFLCCNSEYANDNVLTYPEGQRSTIITVCKNHSAQTITRADSVTAAAFGWVSVWTQTRILVVIHAAVVQHESLVLLEVATHVAKLPDRKKTSKQTTFECFLTGNNSLQACRCNLHFPNSTSHTFVWKAWVMSLSCSLTAWQRPSAGI